MENNTTLLISTFLDPRFKHTGFSFEIATDKAKTLVTDALVALIENKPVKSNESKTHDEIRSEPQHRQPLQTSLLWSAFDMKAAKFSPVGNNRSRAIAEVQR